MTPHELAESTGSWGLELCVQTSEDIRAIGERIEPRRLAAWHDLLAAEPHVASTEGDWRVIRKIEQAFTEMGLKTSVHEFWALLPRPIASILQIVTPETRDLILKEKILEEDLATSHPELDPGWNAFSGSGDVTSRVVYANYGRKEDFEVLRSLGVEVKGQIVIARYGGNYRGYKAKFAEQAGAAGLIIYTDPAESGYAKGLLYPEGGYANDTCIERGSLQTLAYSGDALTPGVEATRDAKRLDIKDVGLCSIPVQPIGYGAALEIMKRMQGRAVAEEVATRSWQGGLPVPYRLTGGEGLTVRLKVEQDREIRRTANVIGVLDGGVEPERTVVVGCHHDAWGFGASDPLAGTIALMESARVLSERSKEGRRPRRSIAFCAWGAEEYGIIGSSEWVEGNRDMLATGAVAYFNLDMASMGPDFGSSAGPSLREVIAEVAGSVPQARAQEVMVRDAWLKRGMDPLKPGSPVFGDLGGGSDHVGFWCHIGVGSAGLGAGGSAGTSYHSIYDTLAWYRKVVGEDYEPARMITHMAAGCALSLADHRLAPLDPAATVREFRRHLRDISSRLAAAGLWSVLSAEAAAVEGLPPVVEVLAELDQDAVETQRLLEITVRSWRAKSVDETMDADDLSDLNARLLAMDRAWILTEGLPDRPWFKNLFAAPDRDSGYAPWMLPLLRHHVEEKDPAGVRWAVAGYRSVMRSLRELAEVPG